MVLKKVTYSLPNLKSLVETANSCVYCIQNCSRSLTVLPAHLDNIKRSVNELLTSKVTTYDAALKGIILGHKNIKVVNHVQLNDDGNFGLDYVSDIYIFKPEVGNRLSGEVNKKSKDHVGVLIHSFFNASIPRPRRENDCPKTWIGFDVNIGQSVTFEVAKVNLSGRLPYINGKLTDVGELDNEDKDSGIGGHESTEENSIRDISVKCEEPGEDEVQTKKKKKKKKKKLSDSLENEEEYIKMEDSIDKSEEDSRIEALINDSLNEFVQESQCTHEKKKKKKTYLESMETEFTTSHNTTEEFSPETTIKKQKKSKRKRKHSELESCSTTEHSDHLVTEEVMEVEMPKKKKKKKHIVSDNFCTTSQE